MPANPEKPELSRRRLLKAVGGAAVLASLPFLGERDRTSAQEATQSPNNQERRIIMPDPEGDQQFIEAFTTLIDDDMKPEGLNLLGMTPILADMNDTPGAWLNMGKSTEMVEEDEINKPGQFIESSSVHYKLDIHDPASPKDYMAYPFLAEYRQYADSPDRIDQMIAFDIGPDGKLRKNDNKDPLPYDSLKSIPETYFKNVDTKSKDWVWFEYPDPNALEGLNGGMNDFVERDGLMQANYLQLLTNGLVLYGNALETPKKSQNQGKQEALGRLTTSMKLFQKRVSVFNIPQA